MQKSFTDQMGRNVIINYPPKRIISIVPSQTELLFDLGLKDEVVGITKFCIHPIDKFASKTKIGGTKKLLIDKIKALQPDLIIGNKEENSQSDIELLEQDFPVWMSDIFTIDDAIDAINKIGALTDRSPEASYLNHLISAGFKDLQSLALQHKIDKKVLYLIWKDPYIAVGKNTFINNILAHNGFTNVIKEERYPEINLEKISALNPDCIFLSSEPYPFNQAHVEELEILFPNAKILLVDGEMFSWYGSRLIKAVNYFFQFQQYFYL
jgi:ABC-type Fe3+-hydroxamate transport system substrate-binding protein